MKCSWCRGISKTKDICSCCGGPLDTEIEVEFEEPIPELNVLSDTEAATMAVLMTILAGIGLWVLTTLP